MFKTCRRRLGLFVALLMTCVPTVAQQPQAKTQYFNGKVLPLATVLEKQGVKLDADAADHWMALVADDGKIYPLIKLDGSTLTWFADVAGGQCPQLPERTVARGLLLVRHLFDSRLRADQVRLLRR